MLQDTKHETYALRSWNQENPNRAIFVKEDKILEEVEKFFESMHLQLKLLSDVISYIRSSTDVEQDFHKRHI